MAYSNSPDVDFVRRERLISLKDVERLTSLKKSSLYSLISAQRFPTAVNVTSRRRAWAETEVQAWIAARLGARSASVVACVGEVS